MQHPLFTLPKNALNILGPAGQLEAIVSPPAIELTPIIGIICHPHPLQEGTMHNKVISTLARTFYDLGLWSLRFNFRGVGESAGVHDNGKGEIDDLLAVTAWVQENFPSHEIWLSGFSFGGYIAWQGAVHPKLARCVKQLVTIAPALTGSYAVKNIGTVYCPWLLVMGEADEIISTQGIKDWISEKSMTVNAIYLPGVGHFFHGHLIALREKLKTALQRNV